MLIGANLLDIHFLNIKNALNSKDPIIPNWGELSAYIALSILLLLLARYVLFVNSRNFLIVITYLLVGAGVLYSMSVSGYFFWSSLIQFSPSMKFWYVDSVASNSGFVRIGSSMIFTIGLLRLLPDKYLLGKSMQPSQEIVN
ncbi:MAG: hypothetical protein CVU41_12965 [Chloroflexi bacterium HGW-Chloroflexi-3]|nr:MAG: hypothetical protein CVU41_12965 [Chloroflexi bacterium HGW-Chloroflexi-3]